MTFAELKERATSTLAIGVGQGHEMIHERDAGLGDDIRVTYRCAKCGARLTVMWQKVSGYNFGGSALQPCDR